MIIDINLFRIMEKKMSEAFEKNKDKRISEMGERTRNNRFKKKVELKNFEMKIYRYSLFFPL